MSKIDIAIKYTSAEQREPVSTSTGVWVSYVRDVRDVFQYLNGVDENKVVTFLSFCKTGCLVTMVRSLQGRGGDNVAAWVYIPSDCDVSGEELSALLADVKGLLFKESISLQQIQALASRNYPRKPVTIDYTPSVREGAYAFRKTDFYPIEDILGSGRYQEYYLQFKGIIILDAADSVTPAISMKDLTRMPIEAMSVLIPPSAAEVSSALGPNASLLYQTPMGFLQFKDPVKIKKGSSITLLAFKKGFDKIPILITSNEDYKQCSFPEGFSPVWKKSLSRNNFKILDSAGSGEPIPSARIVLNGVDLATGAYALNESEIKSSQLLVSASGYEPYEGPIRFSNNDTVVVSLNKIVTGVQYKVISHGKEYDITLPEEADKSSSPLEGYVWGKDDTLHFDSSAGGKKTLLKGALYGFAAATALALIIWAISSPGKSPKPEAVPEEPVPVVVEEPEPQPEPVVEEPVVVDTRNAKLLNYLRKNEVWEQDSLAVHCPGLYEAMNKYNYEKVIQLLSDYQDVPKVKKLLDAMANPVKKSGTYCIDGVITLSTYIARITPEEKGE
jgi:hypothetical protein